jgi:hypothetical protein
MNQKNIYNSLYTRSGFYNYFGFNLFFGFNKFFELVNNVQNDDMKKTIEFIKNITNEQILNHNSVISYITQSNINNCNPTACGTYANSLFGILPEINKYSIESEINEVLIDNVYNYIKKIDDDDNIREIFKFAIYGDEIILENSQNMHFPGHSFVIIKMYKDRYIFTQSYVNVYDHRKYIVEKNLNEVLDLIKKFEYMTKCNTIDNKFVEYWHSITKIDVNMWKNGKINNVFLYSVYKMIL